MKRPRRRQPDDLERQAEALEKLLQQAKLRARLEELRAEAHEPILDAQGNPLYPTPDGRFVSTGFEMPADVADERSDEEIARARRAGRVQRSPFRSEP